MSYLTTLFVVCIALMGYVLTEGIHNISVSAFRIGCMSAEASFEAKMKCRDLAEEKVGYGLFR